MTATAPPDRDDFGTVPLPPSDLPPGAAKLVAAPIPLKALATKGMAPLPPLELGIALYQLAFDPDEAVRAAAAGAPATLPDKLLSTCLAQPLPGPVLHHFAVRLPPARHALCDIVLSNPATDDRTFAVLAARLDELALERIAQADARLLRHPAIVAALFHNPKTRMSSVTRALELCVRNQVRVEGVPAYDEVARSLLEPSAAASPSPDEVFRAAVTPVATEALAEPDEPATSAPRGRAAPIDFTRLKLHEKLRLATLGNALARQHLMRDANRVIALAAVQSPLITEHEIVAAASSRTVSEDVVRYIANSREHTKPYAVRLALTGNPKCPLALSLRFLPQLHSSDIKRIAASKGVPAALSTAARRLVVQRGPQ